MDKAQMLQVLDEKVRQCQKCEELAAGRTQTVFGTGNPDTPVVFCGEGPGKDEDEQGEPFVGRCGQLLTNILKACELPREQVYILNTVKCRPPGNRNPTPKETENCRAFLDLQLEIIQPKYIVCLGAVASQNLLKQTLPMNLLRGDWTKYKGKNFTARVLCTYHPAYLLRNPSAKKDVWEDMKMLMKELKKGA